jgi:hypothetical protein
MLARSFCKLASTTLVVSAIGLGLSASALAAPETGNCACGGARVTLHAARPVPQPPTWPENPQPLPPPQPASSSGDSGFQWDDAGIGAGAALVVALTGVGVVVMLRRRRTGALAA